MKSQANSKILKLTEEMVRELNNLIKDYGTTIDVDSDAAKTINCYSAIQSANALNLSDCELRPGALSLVIKVAATGSSLRSLNISKNLMGDQYISFYGEEEIKKSITDIAKVLPTLHSLDTLNISNCSLGEYAFPLIENLAASNSLQKLYMSNNQLKGDAIPVAKILAQLPSLSTVSISSNYINNPDSLEVMEILGSSRSLCYLYMKNNYRDESEPNNDIENYGQDIAKKILVDMPSLHTVHLEGSYPLSSKESMQTIFEGHNQKISKNNESLKEGCFNIFHGDHLPCMDVVGLIMEYHDHPIEFHI